MVDPIVTEWFAPNESAILSLAEAIVSNSAVASLIAILAWIGSRIYQRPSLWHAVWVIAIIKLFLPPIWTIPVPVVSAAIADRSAATVASSRSPFAESSRSPVAETRATGQPETSATLTANTTDKPETIEQSRVRLPPLNYGLIVLSLWFSGSLIVLLTSARRVARFNGLVRRSTVTDEATEALLCSLATNGCDLRTPPRVRLVDQIVPPLLWPIGRVPTIVLPSLWWETTTQEERKAVLIHELAHWRRGDHWIRLLQWIASIVFWWHPLIWIAGRELHRLEEECCDAEVMYRLPGAGRSYASALLSASQWLDEHCETNSTRCQPSALALPMSRLTQFETFHRRIEMLPNHCYRPWTGRYLIAVLVSALIPLAIGLRASAQQPAAQEKQVGTARTESTTAELHGSVTDTNGKPIAGAKVRVVIPSAELRFPVEASEHREVWGETDSNGNYSIETNRMESKTSASIDILHRGHRRLVGTFMRGGEKNEVTLSPGERIEFDVKLPESQYFAGRVVDEAGKPIEGVLVHSHLRHDDRCGGIEQSLSDPEGRFAVHGYEAEFFQIGSGAGAGKATAFISLTHGQYIDAALEWLEDLEGSERDKLHVVMRTGYSIAGTLLDPSGTPATDVVISISQFIPEQRKAVRTDSQGHFRFDGVNQGKATLRAVDVAGNRKSIDEITIDASDTEMKIELKPIDSPIVTKYQLLGMTLADVNPEIDEAYDLLSSETGVMIIDPGTRFEEFAIGELRPGYVFWEVGNDSVSDLREMVSHLVQEAKSPTIPPGADGNTTAWIEKNGDAKVRVVYNLDNEEFRGSNTQYMRLTQKDIAELMELQQRFESDQK